MATVDMVLEYLRKAEALLKEASRELESAGYISVKCPNCSRVEMRLSINNSDCTPLPFRTNIQIRYMWYCGSCGSERDNL